MHYILIKLMKKFGVIFTLLVILAGCGIKSPEVTTALPKDTLILPTVVLTLTPPTPIPPTATILYTGPIISSLEGQTIADGEQFVPVHLEDIISDADHGPEEITWSHSGEENLNIRITNRVMIVSLPYASWIGSEIITMNACDPDGQCATKDLTYAVERVNDPPELADIDDRLIFSGEDFTEFTLDDYVDDPDNLDDEIAWSFAGQQELDVKINNRTVSVALPDNAWRGPETVQFSACDPEGLCDKAEVDFLMQDDDSIKITFIANAGFLIETGDKKIAIDALLQPWDGYQSLSIYDVNKMENSRWPFDEIDLVIITHDHLDHYDAGVLSTYLQNNPDSFVLSTQAVQENLAGSSVNFGDFKHRVLGVKVKEGESSKMILNGIGVESMNFPHGPGAPQNLGIIVSLGGFRILHTGDLDPEQTLDILTQYAISERGLDVAMVPSFWFSIGRFQDFVTEIAVPNLIPMHFDPATSHILETMQDDFPDAIIFRDIYESWELDH